LGRKEYFFEKIKNTFGRIKRAVGRNKGVKKRMEATI
jgi:hypothetical protein